MSKQIPTISIILIIIAGFAVYANSLNGKFIWDDEVFIQYNRYIKDWSNLPKIFTEDPGAGGGGQYGFYRPIQMITYMIDYSLWGLSVIGYHLMNLLFHILVALAIYWLINTLFNDRTLSFFTSLLFVVHPIHTEAVSYISGRGDPLAALFMLVCLIYYIKYLQLGNKTSYIIMILSYTIALFSKENSLILPFILLLYHYSFGEKIKIKAFLSVLSLVFIYILVRLFTFKSSMPYLSYLLSSPQRIPGFFAAITDYLRLMIMPFNLHMEYGNKLFNFMNPKVISGIVMMLASIIYVFKMKKSNKLVSFSISWFFIGLLPTSNIYPPVAFYMAEHYLYWPSIGFFLVLAKGLSYLYKTKNFRIFTILLLIVLCSFYSYLTVRQNEYWTNRLTFYNKSLEHNPESPKLYNNLGDIYITMGQNEKAAELLKKGIEFNPDDVYLYNNLGRAYTNLGNYVEAMRVFKNAIEINPNFAAAYYNLAIVYYHEKQYDLAIQYTDKALQLGHKVNPDFLKLLAPYLK